MPVTQNQNFELVIDQNIREYPELLGLVQSASEYYYAQTLRNKLEPAERRMTWNYILGDDSVKYSVQERDDYGDREASADIVVSRLRDPISREIAMNSLQQVLLNQRWHQNREVVERLIRQLEAEEVEAQTVRNAQPQTVQQEGL